MRQFLFLFWMVSTLVWSGGCAETGGCAEDETRVGGDCVQDGLPRLVPVACRNSVTDAISVLDWRLAVSPTPIESGGSFSAALDGIAVFNEFFLDAAQGAVVGGLREINLIDLRATVHVRSGATGDDVTISTGSIEYVCKEGRTACDPGHDLPGLPGRQANADCEPQETSNPCGRFVLVPISTDCASGSICEAKGKTGDDSQCSKNGFCVTGDLDVPLDREFGDYVASSEAEVLFGWADESSMASIEEMPIFEDPTGPLSLRLIAGRLPVAIECVMPASTPNENLISFTIETP